MIPFLVTRQIFAGAGKIGIETETHQMLERGAFQISQRSDFFAVLLSIDTMRQRPIINTRDEPHADPRLYRRFHVIIGDSNMNSFATAMKVGTTRLALQLIESNCQPSIALADPIQCLQSISRDPAHRWIAALDDGRTISAIDIQRLYLAAARKHLSLESEEEKKLLFEWERILDDLERDPAMCADRIDWAAKKFLLTAMVEDQGLSWGDPWLQSIDLEYHNVDPDHGLYYALEREGRTKGWGSAHLAAKAVLEPPRSTRAYFRGLCVRKFGKEMSSVQWDEVEFLVRGKKRRIGLEELFAPDQILLYNSLIDKAESPENLLKELEKL
jgi:proteasome accessory factor A